MTEIIRLGSGDADAMEAANRLFGEVFGPEGYHGPPPSREYLLRILADEKFIALVARIGTEMVGALAAYELVKFEAKRSESTSTTSPCARNTAAGVWQRR